MQRPWLTSLTALSSATVFAAMVGCTGHHCSPYRQLFPVVPPLPHHHTYVPNEPLPYQTSPFCFGYHPTCWRTWPEECVACPAPATCEAVVIEDRVMERVEGIPTPPPVKRGEQKSVVPAPVVSPEIVPQESAIPKKPPADKPPEEDAPLEKTAPATPVPPAPDSPSLEPATPGAAPDDLVPTPKASKPAPETPPEPEPEPSLKSADESATAIPPSRRPVTAADDLIAQRVVDRLESQKNQGKLADFDIEVQVAEGVVTLLGEVTSIKQQQTVLMATRKAPGVKKIVNSLTVAR